MSNALLLYDYNSKHNSWAELEKKYCRGVSSNVTSSRRTLSKTGIFVIILTMCMCGRIVAYDAELSRKFETINATHYFSMTIISNNT